MKKSKKVKKISRAQTAQPQDTKKSAQPFIVGIGASAGGLEAIEKFFRNMPNDTGLAFVVVQHLSPDHKSFMVELLSKMTSVPVQHAKDGITVEANNIYLIPPRTHLKLFRGKLIFTEPTHPRGLSLPIDIFFRSLAEEKTTQAVGIVLSGTGSDGSTGVRAIKEMGGTVMVQSIESAQFDGMPRAAIATGCADFILPPEDMPEQLLRYIRHPFVAQGAFISRDQGSAGETMPKIFNMVRERCGVDFSDYRPTTIDRRIERRMIVNQMTTLEDYYRYLTHSTREAEILFNDFLISVTRFFRDREAFDIVAREIIPKLFDENKNTRTIRVWVPACSTGEEAYTLAMLFSEERMRRGGEWDIKIFATDISKATIEAAGLGYYPEGIAAQIPHKLLEKYFVPREHGYQISADLRKMVVFALHDLTKNPPFTKLDFVSCRNVLIYFQPSLQKKVLSAISFGLKPKGILLLGTSETVGDLADRFEALNVKAKIYVSRGSLNNSGMVFTPRPPIGAFSVSIPQPTRDAGAGALNEYFSLESIYKAIVKDYAPGCIVIDRNFDVVHVLGSAGEYLKFKTGAFTKNVLKLVAPTLSAAIASALQKAEAKSKDFTYENFVYKKGKRVETLRLRVKVVPATVRAPQFYLIFIEKVGQRAADVTEVETFDIKSAAHTRIKQLQDELSLSRESLQSTVEELETTNEELQSSNEELMSANEELQSTNEELQSVNEELHTVNAENQRRIEELLQLTNDINNLMRISSIGIMLVDRDLRIRRTSDTLSDMANLKPQDVGAPLETLGRALKMPQIIEMAEKVLSSGVKIDEGVDLADGRKLFIRLAPYVTDTQSAEGLVITLIDVTQRRKDEAELADFRHIATKGPVAEARGDGLLDEATLSTMLSESASPVAIVDNDFRLVGFNPSYEDFFESLFGRKPHRRMNLHTVFEFQSDDLKQMVSLWQQALKGKTVKVEQRFETADNRPKRLEITFSPVKTKGGKFVAAMKRIRDVT